MTRPKGKLDLICEQVGIRIRPITRRRKGPETHARETLRKLINTHGQDHLVLVLKCIRESKNNAGEAWSDIITAISDVLLLRPDWTDRRALDILDALDTLDLAALRRRHLNRRPWPLREGIRTDILNHLEDHLHDNPQPEFESM
tara:strand:+ start:3830 stop:4261 length:432 start_codon:yes stop_codon:yes gene_type:complete